MHYKANNASLQPGSYDNNFFFRLWHANDSASIVFLRFHLDNSACVDRIFFENEREKIPGYLWTGPEISSQTQRDQN